MPNRNGPVSRIFSPVNEGLGVVTSVGEHTADTAKGVWGSLGRGSRRLLGNVTNGVNSAARRLITGRKGGRRNNVTARKNRTNAARKNRSNRNRKNRSNRKSRSNRH